MYQLEASLLLNWLTNPIGRCWWDNQEVRPQWPSKSCSKSAAEIFDTLLIPLFSWWRDSQIRDSSLWSSCRCCTYNDQGRTRSWWTTKLEPGQFCTHLHGTAGWPIDPWEYQQEHEWCWRISCYDEYSYEMCKYSGKLVACTKRGEGDRDCYYWFVFTPKFRAVEMLIMLQVHLKRSNWVDWPWNVDGRKSEWLMERTPANPISLWVQMLRWHSKSLLGTSKLKQEFCQYPKQANTVLILSLSRRTLTVLII